MPVTNFTSVISAQSVGTADVQALASSFDKLSTSIDGATKKSNDLNAHPGFNAFADKVRQGIENPLAAIGSAAEEALKAIGPVGTGIAAVGASFAAAGFAAFEAAKSLGEYGVQIKDIELRTGLAAKEVGQFSFAAKAVGQDVSILDRLMRGLTTAVEDNTEAGAKARAWLSKFGVDVAGLKDGTISTFEALSKVGAGFEKLPAGIQRTTASMDLFKRAGIEAIPFLVELNRNTSIAREEGFGPSEADVARFTEYLRRVTILETTWAGLVRQSKEGLVLTVSFAGNAAGWLLNHLPGGSVAIGGPESDARISREQSLMRDIGLANQMKGRWGNQPLTGLGDLTRARMRSLENLSPSDLYNPDSKTQAQLDKAQRYQDAIEAIQQAQLKAEKDKLDKQRAADAEQEALVQAHVKKLNENLVLARQADKYALGLTKTSVGGFADAYFGDQGPAGKLYGNYGKINADESEARTKFGGTAAFGQISKDFDIQRDAAFATFLNESSKRLDEFNKSFDNSLAEFDRERSERNKFDTPEERQEAYKRAVGQSADALSALGFFNPNNIGGPPGYASPEQSVRDARDKAARGLGLYGVRSSLSGTSEIDQAFGLEALKKKAAEEEYAALIRKADMEFNIQAKQDAADQLHQKNLDAELERQQALLQLALRQKEAFQNLAVGGIEALIHGNGASFLKSTGTSLLDSGVRRLAGFAWGDPTKGTGLSGELSKIIPHGGPLDKIFGLGVGMDPTKASTDANTQATIANTPALRSLRLGGGGTWGGSSTAAGTFARMAAGGYSEDDTPTDGLPTDGSPGDWAGEYSPSGLGLGSKIGIAGAIAAGGFGAYSGFKAGGAQGALTGAGSLAGAGGAIAMLAGVSGPLAPVLLGVGLALPLISSLLGDPKKNRANDLATQQQERSFTMPTGVDYSMDASGRYADYDYTGKVRTVSTPITIYAMDSKSFNDYLLANPTALTSSLASAIQGGNGNDVTDVLTQRLGLA